MRERVDLKSPVREYRPPGSVRGAPGNRRPYLDKAQGEGRGGQRLLLARPIFLFPAPFFLNATGFRFALSALWFQLSAFQPFSFLLHIPPPASRATCAGSAATGIGLQSGRTKWRRTAGQRFFTSDQGDLWVTPAFQ